MRLFCYPKHIACLTVCLLVSFLTACISPPTPTLEPIDPVPPYVEGIFLLTDEIDFSVGGDPAADDLITVLQKGVESDPRNVRAYIILAQAWSVNANYRQVHQNLTIASQLDPRLSDSHYGLGNNYYDLALIDLVMGQKYTQSPDGPLLFAPDETTRKLFKLSLDEYNLGKTLPNSLSYTDSAGTKVVFYDPDKVDQRMRQASLYTGNVPEETIFIEDQSKAGIWMMKLDTMFPDRDYMKTAKTMLDGFVKVTDQNIVQDRYQQFAQQMTTGKEAISKQIFLQIDSSAHPDKFAMGLTIEYRSLVSILTLACRFGTQDDVAQALKELKNNFLAMGISATDNGSDLLPENICEIVGKTITEHEKFAQNLDKNVYQQLLTNKGQATADIFLVTGYSYALDFGLTEVNNEPLIGQGLIVQIDNLQNNLVLSPEQATGLQQQREIFSDALVGNAIADLDDIRAKCSQLLNDVVSSRLNSQSLTTSTPSITNEERQTLFQDDFSSNKNGWVLGETTWDRADTVQKISNGVYQLSAKFKIEHSIVWTTVPDFSSKNFGLGVDAKILDKTSDSSCSVAIAFRYIDERNHYLVEFSESKFFRIDVIKDGKWKQITDWTSNDAIQLDNGNETRFDVFAQESRIYLFVNGQKVFDSEDTTLDKPGNLLIGAACAQSNQDITINFDNLVIVNK
jgi:hypothetical protein